MNIAQLQRAQYANNVQGIYRTTVGTDRLVVGTDDSREYLGCWLRASAENTADLWLGDEFVSVGVGMKMTKGTYYWFPIRDLSKLYIVSDDGENSQSLDGIAFY